MQNRAYEICFAPLPVSPNHTLYYDKKSVSLPLAQEITTLHYHDRYEIGICEKGEGLFISDGIFSHIRENDVIFIPPHIPHYSRSISCDSPCSCRFAYINAKKIEEATTLLTANEEQAHTLLSQCKKAIPSVIRREEYPEEAALLTRLINVCKTQNPGTDAISVLRLTLFIFEAIERFNYPSTVSSPTSKTDDAVSQVAEYFSLHYEETISFEKIAKMCHISPSQLRRRFLNVYGVPPMTYRNMLRCKIAAELLTRTEMSISVISEHVGYTDTSDFYRAFKKIHGSAPSVYRTRRKIP